VTQQLQPQPQPPLSPEAFCESTGVSRETLHALQAYEALLKRWQARINLVGPKTVSDIWRRHFLDSAQIAPLLPEFAATLVDIGSGAGFPGLVVALMRPDLQVHLVDSDQRKATFLREAVRTLDLKGRVTVHAKRTDQIEGLCADVITARALAPLSSLLEHSVRFSGPDTVCLFLKGKRFQEELTDANYTWYINSSWIQSVTDPDGQTLRITEFSKKN